MIATLFVLLSLTGYLLGSVSFAWLCGRLKGIDLRQHGSGNLGATNAGRVLGKTWFGVVFLGDAGKGLIATLAARFVPQLCGVEMSGMTQQLLLIAAAIAAVLGHVFTVFHGFKGGKAVATSLGVLIGLIPLVAAIAFAVWLLAWGLGRFLLRLGSSNAVGPASVTAAIAVPIAHCLLTDAAFARDNLALSVFVIILSLIVIVRHRSNIKGFIAHLRKAPVDTV